MAQIVDFHSHILPEVDDGSHSLEESIALLRMEAEQGITHVVATPHFYPQQDQPERFHKRVAKAEKALRKEMEKYPELPGLSIGAEVYYFPGISSSEAISGLTIDQKRCILIEMPQSPWSESMYQELESLHTKQGLVPIIAHLDRYIGAFKTYGIPERLAELPVLVQANAEFFLRPSTSRKALRMLKAGNIHLLGSDCHNCSQRKPNLGKALEVIRKHLGQTSLEHIASCQAVALEDG